MKKYLVFCFQLFFCVLWYFALNHSWKLDGKFLPKLGSFFSLSEGFWKNIQSNKELMPDDPVFRSKAQVYWDDRMVPHIFSDSLEKVYFAQGYIHAFHRLWQMDFSTLAAEGRVSEVIGSIAVEFDKNKRRKGLAESARLSHEIWKQFPETYKLIQAYADGVNHYIEQLVPGEYPIEYKIMNDAPRKWSPYRSALFHKSMSEVLCGRDKDVELTNAKLFFGNDFELLFPEESSLLDPVIPNKTVWAFQTEDVIKTKTHSPEGGSIGFIPWQREQGPEGLGSNNWAISKQKSSTGNPILCNDPHLSLTLPSIWYEQQLISDQINVYGVSFPGIPGVVIGFNKNVAWGITNAGWDVMDWYKIQWKDSIMNQYLLDGNWKEVQQRIEKIQVKGEKEAVLDTVKLTCWGPVVYHTPGDLKYSLAMHWIIADTSHSCEMEVFKELNEAENYSDYRKAISKFPYPAQNMAFISKSGDIAITVQGNMPLKSKQQGRFVEDGSKSDNGWKGVLPNQFNPSILNPTRGYVASANQKSTDSSFPVYYNDGDFRDYRGTLLNRILGSQELWTVEELKKIQCNNYSLRAETALPLMIGYIDNLENIDRSYLDLLRNWNYEYDSSSLAPAVFDTWFDGLHSLIWDEISADSSRSKSMAMPSDQTTIQLMKDHPALSYYDVVQTQEKENLRDLVKIAYDSIQLKLKGNIPLIQNWGQFKKASIPHMARIPGMGIPFISSNGSKDILNAHARTFGPSWRMLVELTESGPKAFGVYPGGQDGRPGNTFYKSMVEDWRMGRYYELIFLEGLQDPRLKSMKN